MVRIGRGQHQGEHFHQMEARDYEVEHSWSSIGDDTMLDGSLHVLHYILWITSIMRFIGPGTVVVDVLCVPLIIGARCYCLGNGCLGWEFGLCTAWLHW